MTLSLRRSLTRATIRATVAAVLLIEAGHLHLIPTTLNLAP